MEEKFNIGDRVFLIHLQEKGLIIAQSGADMFIVRLTDMEIPVYSSDITKMISGRKEVETQENFSKKIIQHQDESEKKENGFKGEKGIYLAFEPVTVSGDQLRGFLISLVNNTEYPVSFQYSLILKNMVNFNLEKISLPYQVFFLHEIPLDILNEMPVVEIHLRDVMNNSIKADLIQKIKPQNFFNKLSRTALTGAEAYIYKLEVISVRRKETIREPEEKVALDTDLLKQMMTGGTSFKDNELTFSASEIDLHIEALTDDYHTMKNGEMLHLQLASFQQSLDRAIASGRSPFYIIHGVGSGKLKKEIHRMLKNYKEVKSFNNDYNPKYKYGATEVILK